MDISMSFNLILITLYFLYFLSPFISS